MEPTRRLSLTLLLVTPIITARRLSFKDLGLNGVSAWSGPSEQTELSEDWDPSTLHEDQYDPAVYDEAAYSDTGSWLRRKRAIDAPGDDLDTAEQVLFRPTFRYKNLVKARAEHHRLQEELRRQSSRNSPVPASSSRSAVASPPSRTPSQRNYYSTYPQQNQRVYTPQASSVQRLYSPLVSPTQRVYSPNSPQSIPNYRQIVQSSPQYSRVPQYTQNNVGYRPQRSPYAYLYSQRLN